MVKGLYLRGWEYAALGDKLPEDADPQFAAGHTDGLAARTVALMADEAAERHARAEPVTAEKAQEALKDAQSGALKR